jgi:hypothetical protein
LDLKAQKAVADRTDLVGHLAANNVVDLDEDVWFEMYRVKPQISASLASDLVSRQLTPRQRRHVFTTEKRSGPLMQMLHFNHLTTEEVCHALGTKVAPRLAEVLVAQGFTSDDEFPEELRERVSIVAGPKARLAWLDKKAALTEKEAREVLALDELRGSNRVSTELRSYIARLVERFPLILDSCVKADTSCGLLQLAAGSRHLTTEALQHEAVRTAVSHKDAVGADYAMLALANSPVALQSTVEMIATLSLEKCPEAAARRIAAFSKKPTIATPFKDVEDPDVLEWLVRRACSFSSRYGDYTPPKPFELAALAPNPHLSAEQKQRVSSDLHSLTVREQLGESAFKAAFATVSSEKPWELHTEGVVIKYAVHGEGPRRFRGLEVQPEASSGDVVARALSNNFRMHSHAYVENLDLTVEQWRLFLDLCNMMPDTLISEVVGVAEATA